MRRKVVKHGASTLTMSLPSKWVKKYGIVAGDELELEEQGKDLVIRQEKQKCLGDITIELKEGFLRKRLIVIPYIKGYNSIRVRYDNPNHITLIQKAVNLLPGYEIIDQTDCYCIVKNISRGIDEEFQVILNRLFMVTIMMAKDFVEYLETCDEKVRERINMMEITANRFNLLCRRMLNIYGYKGLTTTNDIYKIICLAEGITDHYKASCDELKKHPKKADKETIAIFQRIHELLQEYYSLFKKPKQQQQAAFLNDEVAVRERLHIQLEKKSQPYLVLAYGVSIIDKIHDMSEEIMA